MSETEAALEAIPQADFDLFIQVGKDASTNTTNVVLESCIENFLPSSTTFPLAEPDYNGKRPLNLEPFADALAGFTAARASALDTALAAKSIPEIQALLDHGDLTSVELVTYYLARIQQYDINKLNSVIELNPDALTLAAAFDAARAGGAVLGPMHGIPVLLKDNIATGDAMHTTAGTAALQNWQADRDAFLVQQLRAAGAIIMGKANLSEWANYMDPCMPSGFSTVGGQVRHPYGPYDPMGSSTGSAVAVAAHLTTISVGSETSGSIIQPSRVNSLVALRPSQGLISRDYIIPLASDLDTPGPIGRSVTDVAILLTVMAGVDENDPKSADAAALAGIDFTQYLSVDEAKKLRVGVIIPNQQFATTAQGQIQLLQAVLGRTLSAEEQEAYVNDYVYPQLGGDPAVALAALRELGIEVVEIDDTTLPPAVDTASPLLPFNFQQGVINFFVNVGQPAPITTLADVVAFNNEDPANRAPYGDHYVEWSATNALTSEEYARVLTVAQALAENWMQSVLAANQVDVLVTGMAYSGNAGAAGVPALTVPAGLDPKGLPQGIILSGPYLSEPKLFALAFALEQVLQGRVEPDLEATIRTFP